MIHVQLINKFHNTACKLRLNSIQQALNSDQMNRARNKLCNGSWDCKCGRSEFRETHAWINDERGQTNYSIISTGKREWKLEAR